MILDEQGLFSDNQAIVADSVSENILDMGGFGVSFGTLIPLFIQITEDFNNLDSLTIGVQTSTDEEFSSPVLLAEQTIPNDKLKKGEVAAINFLPKGNLGFVRLNYKITGTLPTTGKILASITDGIEGSFHNI